MRKPRQLVQHLPGTHRTKFSRGLELNPHSIDGHCYVDLLVPEGDWVFSRPCDMRRLAKALVRAADWLGKEQR